MARPRRDKQPFNMDDEVRLIKQHTYLGVPYDTEAQPGDTGIVVEVHWGIWHNKDGNELGCWVIDVTWDEPRPHKLKSHSSYVDADCLSSAFEPVTEEELTEVYALLGVKP